MRGWGGYGEASRARGGGLLGNVDDCLTAATTCLDIREDGQAWVGGARGPGER